MKDECCAARRSRRSGAFIPHPSSLILALVLALTLAVPASATILYVDNSRPPGGAGTADRPFNTLTAAQARGTGGDIIYVAEGSGPYEGGITLQRGQQLIGAAYGIEGTIPAVRGPGPVIHGSVAMLGDNLVAGCTIVAEKNAALNAVAPAGPIAVRKTFIRISKQAFGIFLQNCDTATFEGGGLDAADGATGIVLDGGGGAIAFDHFPIRGAFANAIAIRNRAGGSVSVRGPLTVDDATHDALVVQNDRGSVVFDGPIRVTTHGGRGMVVANADSVSIAGRIDATDAAALEVHDAKLFANFESITAAGNFAEGVVLDKARSGKVVVNGGTIAHASRFGIRIEQSDHLQLSNVVVTDSALYLRHLEHATFDGIDVRGGGGVTASNLGDIAFNALTIANASPTALLLDEAIGAIRFTGCTIRDPAGAALVIEQRFNAGRIAFDHGEISAYGRPNAAPYLVDARTSGGARLELAFDSLRIHDSAGGAMRLAAADASTLHLDVEGAYAQSLGGAFVEASAQQAAHLAVVVHDSHVERPLQVVLQDGAEGCVDAAASALRIRSGAHARLSLVGTPPAAAEIAAEAGVHSVLECGGLPPL